MGLSESTIKVLTEPVNHLIERCGKSDCHFTCCNRFEFEIEQHHSRTLTRDLNVSLENKSKI